MIDIVGKDYFSRNLEVLRPDGSMIFLFFLSGAVVPDGTSLQPLFSKRLTVKGSTLRSRSVEYQAKVMRELERLALPLLADGTLKTAISEVRTMSGSTYRNDKYLIPIDD